MAAGIEPASIGALPIAVRAAVRYMTSIFTIAYLLARH
ncbi:putative membrane protein [Escherichia coli 3-475-03_S3_C1]|nr:putative membrane protein [Escherichia coli 3-475-03_S3_C1]